MLITFLRLGGSLVYLFKDYFPPWETLFNKEEISEDVKPSTKSIKNSKNVKSGVKTGVVLDEFKGVKVYENGTVLNVEGRNTTSDGYNLGLKYQCVEFVKRYYYEVFNHKMPNSYGHAREFYNANLSDGSFNTDRGLMQFKNGSNSRPAVSDLLVYGPASFNKFGHVAIVTKVTNEAVECIAQNLGHGNGTRRTYPLTHENGKYQIGEPYILGWLRIN
jgi:hypothetical protein